MWRKIFGLDKIIAEDDPNEDSISDGNQNEIDVYKKRGTEDNVKIIAFAEAALMMVFVVVVTLYSCYKEKLRKKLCMMLFLIYYVWVVNIPSCSIALCSFTYKFYISSFRN